MTESGAARRGRALLAAVLAASTAAPAVAAHLLAPTFAAGGASAVVLAVDLADGAVAELDFRRSGRLLRRRGLEQSLFAAMGRRLPATPGQLLLLPLRRRGGRSDGLLLVESATGYVAFLSEVGAKGQLGTLRSALGRPTEPLRSDDGNFLLLERLGEGARSAGAFLVHGPTGGCLAFGGLDRVEDAEPSVQPCGPLPPLPAPLAAAPLADRSGATVAYLVAAGPEGQLWRLSVAAEEPVGLSGASMAATLAGAFGGGGGAAPRVSLVALDGAEGTTSVLAVDSSSGGLARIVASGVAAGDVTVEALTGNAYDHLPRPAAAGAGLTLVPRMATGGTTMGAWIVDEALRAVLVEPGEGGVRLLPVEQER